MAEPPNIKVVEYPMVDCKKRLDQFRFMGNCPPTPPVTQHFALCEK